MLNIKLPANIPDTRCIFKITCGDKYYIGKTSNIEWLCTELKKTYGRYMRGGINLENLYFSLLRYYHNKEVKEMRIDVLYATDDGYDLLKFELEQLIEHFGKPDCLNENNIPHVPKPITASKGSNWLTQNQRLNFLKLLKKYKY